MSEKDEICQFCEEFWGEDKRKYCKSYCPCAEYVNQDHIYQREIPIGLPAPQPWEIPTQSSEDIPYYNKLSINGRKRVAEKIGDLSKTMDPVLFRMLLMMIEGKNRGQICKELDISEAVYAEYYKRIKKEAGIAGDL